MTCDSRVNPPTLPACRSKSMPMRWSCRSGRRRERSRSRCFARPSRSRTSRPRPSRDRAASRTRLTWGPSSSRGTRSRWGGARSAVVELAAISRRQDVPQGLLKVWLDSDPQNATRASMPLRRGVRVRQELELPKTPVSPGRDALSFVVEDGNGRTLWRKTIPVMLAPRTAQAAAVRGHLRAAPLRCPDLGARSQDGEILRHAL